MVHLRDRVLLLQCPVRREKCLTDSKLFRITARAVAEPGPGELPVPVGRRAGEPQRLGRLLDVSPAKNCSFSELGGDGVLLRRAGRGQFVQRQRRSSSSASGTDLIEQLEPYSARRPASAASDPGRG